MTADDLIRARLDEMAAALDGLAEEECGYPTIDALRAVLDLHQMGNLASDCDCFDGLSDCPTRWVIATAIGVDT